MNSNEQSFVDSAFFDLADAPQDESCLNDLLNSSKLLGSESSSIPRPILYPLAREKIFGAI